MIYAVEGNVNVGKTTFIKEISKGYNLDIIEESKFISNMKPLERQLYYIEQENEKLNNIMKNDVVMDRTILSVYLYTMFSNEFNEDEKEKIINKINYMIKNNKIIIPDKLFFIIYPFELINKNHQLLKKDKKTQETLVNYKYYLNYNMFFANLCINEGCNIIKTENDRQIIELPNNKIYYNLNTHNLTYKRIVMLDGEEKLIEEVKQGNKENIIIDNNCIKELKGIIYNNEISKSKKIEMIDHIMTSLPLYSYISEIIYIYDNESTKENTINFYKMLQKEIGNKANITIIKKKKIMKSINTEKISNNKQILLIDLLFYIKDCIEKEII